MRGMKGMDKDAIEKKAIEMMEDIGYVDNTDAIDVIEIAKKLGFEVGNAVLKDDVDGFILVEEGKSEILGIKTDKLIGVNSTRNLAWKRFIIAHEIAHYVLQYSKVNNNGMFAHRDHRKGKDEKENEADFFAANLLMPREKFEKKYIELSEKNLEEDDMIILLADKFVVTQPMVERRFGELELNGQKK